MAEWHTCKVMRTGPAEDGTIYIRVQDLDRTFSGERWFKAADSMKKEMLAVALAAINGGFLVTAYLESTDEYSIILRLYVVA